jgi:conjugative relaxase-like TrwC/TraI family protein
MFEPYPMGGNAAEYLTQFAADDYYLSGYDPPGIFIGTGADDLGIGGEKVTKEAFSNLWDGLTPDGTASLVQKQKREGLRAHQPGWDCVFTLPKDLSIAYGRETADNRAILDAKCLHVVKQVMGHFEENYLVSRSGRGGEQLTKANLVAAMFPHYTARALEGERPDIHVHFHVAVYNVCTKVNGKGELVSGTIESRPFYRRQKLLSAMFDTGMYQVFSELGLQTEGQRKEARLEAVSKPICDEFSKRQNEILAKLKKTSESGPEAEAKAQRATRRPKEPITKHELLAGLHAQLDERGLTEAVFHSFRRHLPRMNQIEEAERVLERAATNLTSRQAYFTEARYTEEVFLEARGQGIDCALLKDMVKYRLANEHLTVRLLPIDGEINYTTPQMLEAERKCRFIRLERILFGGGQGF